MSQSSHVCVWPQSALMTFEVERKRVCASARPKATCFQTADADSLSFLFDEYLCDTCPSALQRLSRGREMERQDFVRV